MNKKVMYAVIGVIAVFLVIAVIILLGRGSRDTGQGTQESPDANDWNSGMEETDPGYLAEPEADTDVQEESKPKETEEAMEPAEEKGDTGRNHSSAEDDGAAGRNHSSTEEVIMGEKVSMIALADTKEEAKKIAELYGIELVNFSYGVAEYETTKDPQELIALGEKNNYPTLSTNNTLTIN